MSKPTQEQILKILQYEGKDASPDILTRIDLGTKIMSTFDLTKDEPIL